jgi:hypothetical protein
MNLEKIIEEIYSSPSGNYSASSEAPRKDFAPISKTDGYNYPYQRDGSYMGSPIKPDAPVHYPWPLQTIEDDLSDAFAFIASSMSKISQSVKNNPSLDDEKKEKAIFLYKKLKKSLNIIKNVGLNTGSVFNIAGQQPDQNTAPPAQALKDESLPQKGDVLKIKLP